MGFRRAYKLLTEAPGSYVAGTWQPGVRSVGVCVASVQPDDEIQDMRALDEGRHESDRVKVYSSQLLQVANESDGTQADIIVQDGKAYEITSRAAYRAGVISHYRYQGTKVFDFTTDEAWISGELQRP